MQAPKEIAMLVNFDAYLVFVMIVTFYNHFGNYK